MCRAVVKIKGRAVDEDAWCCVWNVGCAGVMLCRIWVTLPLMGEKDQVGQPRKGLGLAEVAWVVEEPLGIDP